MRLTINYPHTQNHGFNYVYKHVEAGLRKKYPTFEITHNDCADIAHLVQQASLCGGSSLSIVNEDTKKCIILSFTDVAEIHVYAGHGYDHLHIIEVYGGLAFGNENLTPQGISDRWKIRYVPFQYPLPYDNFEEHVQNNRKPYNPNEKIRKAIFLGALHPERQHIVDHLEGHPLFDIRKEYVAKEDYWNEMSKYAMILSLNGNGEFCVRDVEGYGLGIPTVRSEIASNTRFYPLIPDVHYIRGSEPSSTCRLGYRSSYKEIAEQFIEAVEKTMYNDDLLMQISQNGIDYYENYCKFDSITNLFLDLFEPEVLL